jgi:putative nucleotidyltransferase with HDIG domain
MALLFGVATLVVLAAGLFVARSVTAPLLKLVRAAEAVSSGDLTARSGVDAQDEVGVLAKTFDSMTERLATQRLATIRALTSAIDARDPYTAGHSTRVGQLAVEIGRKLELPKRDLEYLEIGGYLHDIGKIGIRDNILLKQGLLTDEERKLIEEHPKLGIGIIQQVELAQEILDIVGRHHERLDGSGYPYGLYETQLSIFPRIGSVADIYDALSTDRPYRAAMELQRVIAYLRSEAMVGHLDAAVVQALVEVMPVWERRRRSDKTLQGFHLPDWAQPTPTISPVKNDGLDRPVAL